MDPQLIKTVLFSNWYSSYKIWGWVREIHNIHQCKNYTKYNNITLDWCCEYGTMSLLKEIIGGTDTTKYYDLLHQRWFGYLRLVMTRESANPIKQHQLLIQRSASTPNRVIVEKDVNVSINEREFLDLFTFIFDSYLNCKMIISKRRQTRYQEYLDAEKEAEEKQVQREIERLKQLQLQKEKEDAEKGIVSTEPIKIVVQPKKSNVTPPSAVYMSRINKENDKENLSILLMILENENKHFTKVLLDRIKFTDDNIKEFDLKAFNQYFNQGAYPTRMYGGYLEKKRDPNDTLKESIPQLIEYIDRNHAGLEVTLDGFFMVYAVWTDNQDLYEKLLNGREMDYSTAQWFLDNYAHGKMFQLFHKRVGRKAEKDYGKIYSRITSVGDLDSVILLDNTDYRYSSWLPSKNHTDAILSDNFQLIKFLVDKQAIKIKEQRQHIVAKKRMDYIIYMLIKVECNTEEEIQTTIKDRGSDIIASLVAETGSTEFNDMIIKLFIEYQYWDFIGLAIKNSSLKLGSGTLFTLMKANMDSLVLDFIQYRLKEESFPYTREFFNGYPCFYRIFKSQYQFDLEKVPLIFKKVLCYESLGYEPDNHQIDSLFIKMIWRNETYHGNVDLIEHFSLLQDSTLMPSYGYQTASRDFLESALKYLTKTIRMIDIYTLACSNGYLDIAERVFKENPDNKFISNLTARLIINDIQLLMHIVDNGSTVLKTISLIKENSRKLCVEEAFQYAITSKKRLVPFTEKEVCHMICEMIFSLSPGFYEAQIESIIKFINQTYPDFKYDPKTLDEKVSSTLPYIQGTNGLFNCACLKGWTQFAKEIFNKHYRNTIAQDEYARSYAIKSILVALEYGNLKIAKYFIENLDPVSYAEFIQQAKLKVSLFYQSGLYVGHLHCWNYLKNDLNHNVF